MRSEQFQRFLSDTLLLTKKQRIILDEALTQKDSSNTLEQVIKRPGRFHDNSDYIGVDHKSLKGSVSCTQREDTQKSLAIATVSICCTQSEMPS